MANIRKLVLLLVVLLALGLASCAGQERESEPAGPLVAATVQPPASPTRPPDTVAPSPEPAKSATPIPPTPTVEPPRTAEPSATPVPATATTTPSPSPTSTPTASPQPSPTATATPAGIADLRIELQRVTGGLEVPVGLAHAGDGSGRLFVVEKAGRIRVLENGMLLAAPLLDIVERVGSEQSEQGLLGLAFHPGFAQNGRFYVNYTDRQGDTVISRFSMASGWEPGGPPVADPGSEVALLKLDQPASNHNGGHLAFGPDGYLYIGTGDGGGAGDRYGNGQNGATLLGAMLRIDVDGGEPYAIPADNPFVGDPGVRDEIWALGLRNPWRYSFDRLTGDLWIADVGQNVYEEVDFQPADHVGGWNYGWPIMEGNHCYPADLACNRAGLTLPLLEYDHSQGCSVTGGFVYRGPEFPAFQGTYVFGDFCTGRIWGVARRAGSGQQVVELARADLRVSSFGEDERGEIYLLDMERGEVFRLVVVNTGGG